LARLPIGKTGDANPLNMSTRIGCWDPVSLFGETNLKVSFAIPFWLEINKKKKGNKRRMVLILTGSKNIYSQGIRNHFPIIF
jgi:hypothetical protein